jgi:hypothetical protein
MSAGGAIVVALLSLGLRETAPRVLRRRSERAAAALGPGPVVAGAAE